MGKRQSCAFLKNSTYCKWQKKLPVPFTQIFNEVLIYISLCRYIYIYIYECYIKDVEEQGQKHQIETIEKIKSLMFTTSLTFIDAYL